MGKSFYHALCVCVRVKRVSGNFVKIHIFGALETSTVQYGGVADACG